MVKLCRIPTDHVCSADGHYCINYFSYFRFSDVRNVTKKKLQGTEKFTETAPLNHDLFTFCVHSKGYSSAATAMDGRKKKDPDELCQTGLNDLHIMSTLMFWKGGISVAMMRESQT